MESIDGVFLSMHAALGGAIPLDQLKFLVCQLSVLPFSFLVTLTPPSWTNVRHTLCILISLLLMSISIGQWCFVHSLLTSSIVYLVVWNLPARVSPLIVFIFAMGYMSVSHIYRMYTDWGGWHIDFTASQMIVTLKLISFAFCVADGSAEKDVRKLSPYQLEHRLTSLPTPLEYFGYIYFFPSFLCGPPIEIADYLKWANYSMFPSSRVPHTFFPAIKQLVLSFLILIPVFASILYPPSLIFSDEFNAQPLIVKMVVTMGLFMIFRAKYHMLWFLAEAGYISCGFAYKGEKDGRIDWSRTTNVYPIDCEFGDNIQKKTRGWNIMVSDWLKYYVYMRLMPEGRGGAPPLYVTLATYGVSAIWHGFYPGYYLFFMTFAVVDQLARKIRTIIRPHFLPEGTLQKRLYDVACFFFTNLVTNYLGASFVILDHMAVIHFWSLQHFWGHILIVVTLVVLTVWGAVAPPPKSAPRAKSE